MFETIDNLRQKPDRSKKRIAFFTAFSFCLIIFIIWLTVIYPDFKRRQNNKNIYNISSTTPVDTFTGFFSQGFSELGGRLKDAKESVQNLVSSSTPYYYSASSTAESASSSPINKEENMEKIQ